MKLIRLLAAAAMALTATTAMAQGGAGGGQGGGQRMMDMMMKDITLSDVQKAKIDSIVAGARAESMKLREGLEPGTQPSPELREKMTAVTTKRNEAIKAVLTPDQQTIFAKNLESMPAMGRPRPPR
jgi:Spy/CpxP family protein refolding chaperone